MGVNGQQITQRVRRNHERLIKMERGWSDAHVQSFLFPRSLIPAVSLRGERPTSSFVHPGMWDILTGWLFIDSAQLRVPPEALSLRHSCVCNNVCVSFYSIISLISQLALTQENRALGNASQTA